jgi:hypothetical protein
MAPFAMLRRLVSLKRNAAFDPSVPSTELHQQWIQPGDVFSLLLILGGEVVARSLAQTTGRRIGPPSFSFGASNPPSHTPQPN